MALIEIGALTKRYGRVRGVEDLSLAVEPGEIFGLLGPNGAGKTTAIRILGGFLRPDSGTARVFGLDCWSHATEIKRELGFLPDFSGLYEDMAGLELLEYLGGFYGARGSLLREELCHRLELSEAVLQRKVKGYSKGMKQKLSIVQALQHNPSLLILDEPTEGLDPLMQQRVFQILVDLKGRGCTMLVSSHILPEAERLCDRVGMIKEGRMAAVERVEELRRKKVRRMTVTFAGDAEVDLASLPCVVRAEREGRRVAIFVRGDVNPLLRLLSRYDLEDLVFEPAHLEDVFLEYYREGGSAGP